MAQDSVLGTLLYRIYTSIILEIGQQAITKIAYDTALLAVDDNYKKTARKWQKKTNETKSIHMNYTNWKAHWS